MFRLMNGIFANSLHRGDFCFDRHSASKCRSSRKSSLRDCMKNPLAVELGKISGQKNRLLELNKFGCHCSKKTAKERWFFNNQCIIVGLATALDRPPNEVSDFLYFLTLQNFCKLMEPPNPPGAYCKVPFAYGNACEDYRSLFDSHGNIRSRFSQDSLKLLMRLMQSWLKNGTQRNAKPFNTCFGDPNCKSAQKNKARKAGIDSDSVARQNGIRRLKESAARARLSRIRLTDPTTSAFGLPFAPGEWIDPSAERTNGRDNGTFRNGDPGFGFGRHRSPKGGLEDELAAKRFRQLQDQLTQVDETTSPTRGSGKLINAIRDIKVVKPGQDAGFGNFGKDYPQDRHKKHLSNRNHLRQGYEKLTKDQEVTHEPTANKVYYGDPIPVLVHEPYDQDKPWTWLRRHPHQKRMTDKGEIVGDGTIRRYRRDTINIEMLKARARSSVHSVLSTDQADDVSAKSVPIFGPKPNRKPAKNAKNNANRRSLSPRSIRRR